MMLQRVPASYKGYFHSFRISTYVDFYIFQNSRIIFSGLTNANMSKIIKTNELFAIF